MEVIETVEGLRPRLEGPRRAGARIGLVPTMGFFHDGHLTLMRQSRQHDDLVVVSLYVNPTQFGPREDFREYPRDLERDARLAREVGVDVLFVPTDDEMYPPGAATFVEVGGELPTRLCGAYRPGHFRGVATVVAKLFTVVQPQRAYFGEKDYQQLLIVKRLVRDLRFALEIVAAPTVREPDGLAMSSRNSRLDPEQRQAAGALYRALLAGRETAAQGTGDAAAVLEGVRQVIAREPLVQLQYAELADAETLAPVDRVAGPTLLAVAAHVGATRLIDNMIIAG